MYRKTAVFVCGLFFLGSMLTTIGLASAQADTVKLTYSNFFPPTHVQSRLAEAWCREVEARTDGKIKIDYYPGQTLTKAKQCYDGVVNGLSDIGMSCFAYTRGRFPVMAAIDLPLGYASGKAATELINQFYDKFSPEELGDTQVMYLHAHGPGLVHTKDKQIRKMEDIKGLKFRATGTSALVVKALGGTPVPKPMPESYEMLAKGVVDGSVYPVEANRGWKLGEVTRYCTAAFGVAYTTSFFVVMNKDKWNSLPKDVQKTIEQVNLEWTKKHGDAWDASDMNGIRYFLNQGGQITGVAEKDQEQWIAAVAPIMENYVKDAEKKGLPGKEIMNFLKRTLKELQ